MMVTLFLICLRPDLHPLGISSPQVTVFFIKPLHHPIDKTLEEGQAPSKYKSSLSLPC